MKAPEISQTVLLPMPESARLRLAFAGLKPGVASYSGLQNTHSQSTVTSVTPMAVPGTASSISPTITPAKIAK